MMLLKSLRALFLLVGVISFSKAVNANSRTNRSSVGHLRFVNHPDAKCLDGSPPAYYLRNGFGDGSDKWLVFFQGGGWCYDLQRCDERARSRIGSSRSYKPETDMDLMYKSNVKRLNPLMYNWNMVYVQYCDSSSFAGDAVHQYKGKTLYFKGRANRDETIRSLFQLIHDNSTSSTLHGHNHNHSRTTSHPTTTNSHADHSLRTATEVVFGGCSAGGLSVLLGLDAMASIVQSTAKLYHSHPVTVRGLSDSGFFMPHTSATASKFPGYYEPVTARTMVLHRNKRVADFAACMRDVFDFMNISAGANAGCVRAARQTQHTQQTPLKQHTSLNQQPLPLNPQKRSSGDSVVFSPESNCIFAQHLAPHIQTPLFLLHPQYDSWQTSYVLGSTDVADINSFGCGSIRAVRDALLHGAHPGHGVYVDSCAHHCTQCWSGAATTATSTTNTTNQSSSSSNARAWSEANAFATWYRHSLNNSHSKRKTHDKPTNGTSAVVEGINWFINDQPYPCKDCCKCVQPMPE